MKQFAERFLQARASLDADDPDTKKQILPELNEGQDDMSASVNLPLIRGLAADGNLSDIEEDENENLSRMQSIMDNQSLASGRPLGKMNSPMNSQSKVSQSKISKHSMSSCQPLKELIFSNKSSS